MTAKIYNICDHPRFRKPQNNKIKDVGFSTKGIDFSAADYIDISAYQKYRVDVEKQFPKESLEVNWTGDKKIY